MKKFCSIILVLVMVLAMAACSSGAKEEKTIDSIETFGDVMEMDCTDVQSAVFENVAVMAFKYGDTYYRVTADITPEESQAIFDLEMDENFDDNRDNLMKPFKIKEIEDLSSHILTDDELGALVGKTGKDLMEDGWTFSGHDLETMEFWMEKDMFVYTVTFDGEVAEADWDSFEDETGTADMTVTKAELYTLGDATNIDF